METAGYIASLFIGVSLGLIGGGGSILTVPVLVYLFAISPTIAISYSLFIVGSTSLVGAYNNYRKGLVNFKTVLLFGSSSITTVFIARKFIIPFLPNVFFRLGAFEVTHSLFVMVVFAILMLAASVSMIKSRKIVAEKQTKEKPWMLVMYGVEIHSDSCRHCNCGHFYRGVLQSKSKQRPTKKRIWLVCIGDGCLHYC